MEAKYTKRKEHIVAAATKAPGPLRPYLCGAAAPLAVLLTAAEVVLPYVAAFYGAFYKIYQLLEPYHPEDLAQFVIGVFICFFGGAYPAIITAIEAYRQIGWGPTVKALKVLHADFQTVAAASKKDDAKDADGDGIADVDQMSAADFVERKTLLMLRTTDPTAVGDAVSAISVGWVAVLAALKISFARAIALGAAIGDVLCVPALRYGAPMLKRVTPEEYQKWIVPGLTYTCKFVAISVAWTVQRVISACHSAVRGGQLAGKGLVAYLHKYGLLKKSADDTYLDEIVGYALMVLGLLFQLSMGFSLPFPLNIILLPVTICEKVLVWVVMD